MTTEGNGLTATGMFLFFSRNDSLVSRLIRRVCGCPWSHCGFGFSFDEPEKQSPRISRIDANGAAQTAVYYEALFGRQIAPPRPLADLAAWAAAAKGREFVVVDIPFVSPEIAERKRMIAETFVQAATYGGLQLLAMFFFLEFGWRVPRSVGRVVCSEFVARVLFPEIWMLDNFDEVTPGDVWNWAMHAGTTSPGNGRSAQGEMATC